MVLFAFKLGIILATLWWTNIELLKIQHLQMYFLLEEGVFPASFTMVTTMVSESPKPGVVSPSKWPKSRIRMEIQGRDVPSSILPKKKMTRQLLSLKLTDLTANAPENRDISQKGNPLFPTIHLQAQIRQFQGGQNLLDPIPFPNKKMPRQVSRQQFSRK